MTDQEGKNLREEEYNQESQKSAENEALENKEIEVQEEQDNPHYHTIETAGSGDKPAETTEEEFDWENFEKEQSEYGPQEKKKYEELYDKTLSTIKEKEVVEGTVVSVTKKEVVVNIGYKSEGVVSRNELRHRPDIKPGDTIEVYIESQEDKDGQLILSHKKARTLKAWENVNKAYENDEIIQGYIKCRTKGGMIVDVFGIETFLPGSQIDVKPIRDYDAFVGKTMDFKVVKINHEFRNVVVSHKAIVEEELEQQKKEIISKLEKGQVLEGTVKNITSYGVFIDLGGIDGLIHITDLSWGRVNHPEEIVELDQKLNVVILDFDDEKKRIALGLKQLTPHPWDSLDPNLKVGDVVKGKVVVLADYGAFVEIQPGVEGLIHVSEMSWSQHLRSAQEFLQVGDEVEAQILTLDREERKMSLGIKQLKPDPWENIEEKYPVDSKHKATVRNFTNFGVFVELEEGVDGLIHISDLSWTKKINHPAEFVSIGDEIEVKVLEIDKDNRRLSLGHKQLEENPWDAFEQVFTEGSIHEGTVIDVFDKGAMVALPYGVEGFVAPKHLVKEDGNTAKVDEKLSFKVIEFNKEGKKIVLSHRRVYEDEKRDKEKAQTKTTRKNMKKVNKNVEKTTLGDISDLASLKDEMQTHSKAEARKKAEEWEEKAKAQKEESDTTEETGEKEEKETQEQDSGVSDSEQKETQAKTEEEGQQEETGSEEQSAGQEEQTDVQNQTATEEENSDVEAKQGENESTEEKEESKEDEGDKESGNEEEKQ
ncbi:MAG: 30S ribosomal protein S1 [Bacteroidales bacterium]|nr:30S ribosomal protein S1 [Bacteroidales bacterium]MBS3773700.1 30S ribosomal protein S1 [Bacteroidales bacterium]